jgi:hypothetical protein
MKVILPWIIGVNIFMQFGCHYAMFPGRSKINLELLEKDWKEGGNRAQQYELNEFCWDGCCGSTFSQAIQKNKPVAFIQYLISQGARVQQSKTYTSVRHCKGNLIESTAVSDSLAIASCNVHSDIVRILVEQGGLKHLNDCDKNGMLIRFIRESKKDKIEDCVTCLSHLINAGCPLDCDAPQLSEIAYMKLAQQNKTYCSKLTSPLIEAIHVKAPQVIKLLLEAGADPDKKYNGKSARDVAQEKSWFQKGIFCWVTRPEENLLEQEIATIKTNKAKALEDEILVKSRIESSVRRLENYVTRNKQLMDITYLVSMQRR